MSTLLTKSLSCTDISIATEIQKYSYLCKNTLHTAELFISFYMTTPNNAELLSTTSIPAELLLTRSHSSCTTPYCKFLLSHCQTPRASHAGVTESPGQSFSDRRPSLLSPPVGLPTLQLSSVQSTPSPPTTLVNKQNNSHNFGNNKRCGEDVDISGGVREVPPLLVLSMSLLSLLSPVAVMQLHSASKTVLASRKQQKQTLCLRSADFHANI